MGDHLKLIDVGGSSPPWEAPLLRQGVSEVCMSRAGKLSASKEACVHSFLSALDRECDAVSYCKFLPCLHDSELQPRTTS